MGIEIKEWDKRVHPKMAMEYLETYRDTCEYFYLAAKKFSRSTLELKDIGLFDLGRIKVIKDPGYLYISRYGIQGEFDEENKKQIQGTDQCCRRPVPEDDSGVLEDVTRFFGFEHILNDFPIDAPKVCQYYSSIIQYLYCNGRRQNKQSEYIQTNRIFPSD
ncbi:hypothetical protein METP3_01250 [Methanosarcinales archaeon]|nr:MAG: hypothetical protein OI861_00055 [Candidatus Methanoperedens sp.]CAG0967817.1 hypothetical protein METP3_01250 [Methanosarcinales archaeon]